MKWVCGLLLCLGTLLAPAQLLAKPEELRVAAIAFPSSAPLFLAKELGYYEAENLEVTFQFFDAAQPIAIAVANRQAEIGATAFTAGVYNLAAKDTLRVIAAQSREEPGHEFLAYVASEAAWRDGLRQPEDLRGHSLGITQRGSSHHLMAGLLAKKKGFSLNEIELVQLERVARMETALRDNEIDAAILPYTYARRLERSEEGRIVGWVSQETPYQLGGIFTSSHMAERERQTVERFLRAYQRASRDYAEAFHPSEGTSEEISEKRKELTALLRNYIDAKPEAIREGASYIDPKGRLDVGSIYRQVQWYREAGLVDPEIDPAVFLDLSFIQGHHNVPEQLQQDGRNGISEQGSVE